LGVTAREDMLGSVELVILFHVLYGELMRVGSVILAPLLINDEVRKYLILRVVNFEIGKRLLDAQVVICSLYLGFEVSL
jgi:hypothetical protein